MREKNATIAYTLNIIFPGIGNMYFYRPKTGLSVFFLFLMSIFLLFFGAYAAELGQAIIVFSIILVFFTAGISILAIPLGVLLLVIGVGSLVSIIMWIFCIILSEIIVYQENKKVEE